jgi:hypothetical protein
MNRLVGTQCVLSKKYFIEKQAKELLSWFWVRVVKMVE